mmetsp:Transcript_141620/g.353102  ORF Transcript_141620/g.353102 Transcript_141620/m.353102 type:complete len:201 (+) Transcript_141620:1610-2212(+)
MLGLGAMERLHELCARRPIGKVDEGVAQVVATHLIHGEVEHVKLISKATVVQPLHQPLVSAAHREVSQHDRRRAVPASGGSQLFRIHRWSGLPAATFSLLRRPIATTAASARTPLGLRNHRLGDGCGRLHRLRGCNGGGEQGQGCRIGPLLRFPGSQPPPRRWCCSRKCGLACCTACSGKAVAAHEQEEVTAVGGPVMQR